MSNNPFIDYLVKDIQKEIGDADQFVYQKVEQPFGLCLIKAAELAGFKATAEWNAPAFRTLDVIVQR